MELDRVVLGSLGAQALVAGVSEDLTAGPSTRSLTSPNWRAWVMSAQLPGLVGLQKSTRLSPSVTTMAVSDATTAVAAQIITGLSPYGQLPSAKRDRRSNGNTSLGVEDPGQSVPVNGYADDGADFRR